MKITQVEVSHFGCVRHAEVTLGPGLNVLYGPNDLGKSTLTRAIRAALLLPHSSAEAKTFAPWDSDEDSVVKVTLGMPDGRFLQVEKRFGKSAGSLLRESNDGHIFNSPYKKGREVDAELREKLAWGVASPATKGIKRGLPVTFLSTVLLGEQANVSDVLNTTLEADTDESGRERLTAALSAFAQDPLFKSMLETAQAKVDEAYTATGRPRKSVGSPFVAASKQVDQAKAELAVLQTRATESEGAIAELAAKTDERNVRQEQLAERTAELEAVNAALAKQAERAALEAKLAAAKGALSAAQQRRAELEKREADLVLLREQEQALEAAKKDAGAAADDAQGHVRAAEETLARAQSAEAEQAREIRRGQLEKKQLELESAAKSLAAEREKVERGDKLEGEARAFEARLEALAERESGSLGEADKAKSAKAEAEAARADLSLARKLRRVRETEAELAELEAAQAQNAERAAKAKEARTREAKARKAIREDLPAAAEVAAMSALVAEGELANARLGGGMAISVERLKEVEIHGSSDGEALPHSGEQTLVFDAERAFTLSIGDVARLSVKAGTPEARAAASRLQARVQTEVEPTLARLGAADVAALQALIDENEAQARECDKLASEAQALESIAAAQAGNLSKLQVLPGRLAELRGELGDAPLEAAEALLEELGDASLEGREVALRENAELAAGRLDAALEASRQVATERQLVQQSLDASKAALAELGVDVPKKNGGWVAALAALEERSAQVALERTQTDGELNALTSEQASEVASLQADLDAAKAKLAEAKARLEEAAAAIGECEKNAATLQGEINMSRADIERVDLAALKSGVDEIQALVDALPAAQPVDEGAKEEARANLEAAKHAHERAHDDVRKAEGRLQTVSGQVVVEETARAKEALTLAEHKEREIATDYAGWSLLASKLRHAENTEGQHLGEALSQPVSRRFSELTGERYSKLKVKPTLGTEGVVVAGIERNIASLSVGTQEQLATLLRLTIAEQLEAMLILDDHLTQTDAERIAWFRRALRTHASVAQVIVVTCHPLDYLDASEMPGEDSALSRSASGLVHAMDLSRLVERSGGAAKT